jgi:hypothetical protein
MGVIASCAGAGPLARCPPISVVGDDDILRDTPVKLVTVDEPAGSVADSAGKTSSTGSGTEGGRSRLEVLGGLLEREPRRAGELVDATLELRIYKLGYERTQLLRERLDEGMLGHPVAHPADVSSLRSGGGRRRPAVALLQ